ncbi:MAG: penicillin-binding protein activator [Nitrospinota bacterium]|nr:penicillin-binding protein activator [Nitrospinota bacterium]
MRKSHFFLLGFFVLVFSIFSYFSFSEINAAKKIVKIGFMAPLTGGAASYGLSIKKGVDLANKEIGGGFLKIVYEDSKCSGKEAVSAINKLISIDKVSAIVGEVCSGATLASAPIAERNKVVMISSSSTSPKITNAGVYIFRTVPSDALQGDFGAKYVYSKGYRKLAILFSNEEYGLGFSKVLSKSFAKVGGAIVAKEKFKRDATDLRTQLTKIKSSAPDSIYIISNSPPSAVSALKQIKELGIRSALFGSEGLKSDAVSKGSAGSAEGLIVTSVSSGTNSFAKRHLKVYGKSPGPFAAQAYDALKAIALAVGKGARTGTQIKSNLSGISFDGASGRIKFDSNGDVSGNYDIFVVKAGKFVPSN